MQASEPWFHRPDTKRVIDYIARAEQLTIIVGAGVSADSGLPTWNSLLLEALRERASILFPDVESSFHGSFSAEILKREGSLGAGTILEILSSTDEELAFVVKNALYRGTYPQVGWLAHRVAAIAVTFGVTEILTTNYDDLLERALTETLKRMELSHQVVPVVRHDQLAPPDSIAVCHLHGYLPFGGDLSEETTGRLVIGERGYAASQEHEGWRQAKLVSALEQTTCLFVGISLTDPYLVRYLVQARGTTEDVKRSHWFISTRERGIFEPRVAENQDLDDSLEQIQLMRLLGMGLNTILPNYHSQVSQFLNEVTLWRALLDSQTAEERAIGGSYAGWDGRYGARLADWYDSIKMFALSEDDDSFQIAQREVNGYLRRRLAELLDLVATSQSELFALHVWLRQPNPDAGHPRALLEWAMSTSALASRHLVRRAPIHEASLWRAAKTFCAGSGQVWVDDPDYERGRWRSTWAQPIYLQSDRWVGLPVGVVTLSSTDRFGALALEKRRQHDIWETLTSIGEQLLDPEQLEALLNSSRAR